MCIWEGYERVTGWSVLTTETQKHGEFRKMALCVSVVRIASSGVGRGGAGS